MLRVTMFVCGAVVGWAGADVVTYSGSLNPTRALFNSDTGGAASMEDFESFQIGDVVGDMPNNAARFSPEYADGSAAPLPVVITAGDTPSGIHWIANTGNMRPAWSAWVIRPDNPGDLIYAFGQANAQGDWVRIQGFDAQGELVVTVDAQPIVTGCFAGFIAPGGVSKVVVTPLGNQDGLNGMDDVQISTTPFESCGADFNDDGALNAFDVFEFLSLYNAGDPAADLATPFGTINAFDIFAFLDLYNQGCP